MFCFNHLVFVISQLLIFEWKTIFFSINFRCIFEERDPATKGVNIIGENFLNTEWSFDYKKKLLIQFVESMWLKQLTLRSCLELNFLPKKQFIEILPRLMEKTKQLHVLHALVECRFAIASFDLWMSKGAYHVFALVINFLGRIGN
jgi:hypothetical protein